ncbi:MAG: hypothetical protein ABRQ25_11360, partial [Clostridiaceae bacterium]
MYTSIGVNLNKELRYLSKRKRMPKISHNNFNSSGQPSIEPLIQKYTKNISNIIGYIKDKTSDFKSSMDSGTNDTKSSQVHYFCCKDMSYKRNIVFMSLGAIAVGYGIKYLLKHN